MNNIVSTDPIADMLTRLRNAVAIRKSEVNLPYSKLKTEIAKLLKSNNFINDYRVTGEKTSKTLIIVINDSQTNPRITEINRLSSPGRRIYVNSQEIKREKRGRGLVILSTSKGLMSGEDAQKLHIGGELICKVY